MARPEPPSASGSSGSAAEQAEEGTELLEPLKKKKKKALEATGRFAQSSSHLAPKLSAEAAEKSAEVCGTEEKCAKP